jgi:transcription antitermination factor NusG
VRDQVELERELTHLKEIVDRAGFLTPAPLLVQGTKVEVVSGPFRGAVGEVASLHERNRLILQVNALGQGASLELDGSLVRPLDR